MEKTRGILIRRFRFSETSLIAVWITDDHGKIRTAARGALRPKSPFRGLLDVFYEVEIAFTRAATGDLHTLRETALIQPFDGSGTQYANLSVATYFGDLTDLATEASAPAAGHFQLLSRAVTFLRTNPPTLRAITHFESELCQILGIRADGSRADPLHALAAHCGRIPASRARALRTLGAD